jgi:hypothetical protein
MREKTLRYNDFRDIHIDSVGEKTSATMEIDVLTATDKNSACFDFKS